MRILLISPVSPYPPHRGGAQRTNLVFRALQEIAEVHLLMVAPDRSEFYEELHELFNLRDYLVRQSPGERFPFSLVYSSRPKLANKAALSLLPKVLEYRPDPTIAPRVREIISEEGYDLVVGRYLRPMLKSGCVGYLPTILDVDDIDSHVYQSRLNDKQMPAWERWINRSSYLQTKRLLPGRFRQFDQLWFAHEDQLREFSDLPHKVCLPNIPFPSENGVTRLTDDDIVEPATTEPGVILFVGTLNYAPNEAAVDRFLKFSWPVIHQAEPRTVFRIVGSRLEETTRARWAAVPGVEPIGFVKDVHESYASCMFTVTPVLTGSGTNIKILESFAHGRTCVVTRFAHRPFADTLPNGETLMVADDDEAFTRACLDLLWHPERRRALAERGRAAVRRHFSFERFRTVVAESVHDCLARRSQVPPRPPGGHLVHA